MNKRGSVVRVIEEHKGDGTYSVAYACADNLVKVVRINECSLAFATNTAQLQIQRIGIEPKVEWLDFEDGLAATHHVQSLSNGSSRPFLQYHPDNLEMVLRKFASEFKEVMQKPNLQPYLQTHLGDLLPYLR